MHVPLIKTTITTFTVDYTLLKFNACKINSNNYYHFCFYVIKELPTCKV